MKRQNNMNKLKLFVFALSLGTAAQAQTLQDANKKTENERYDLARKEYQKLIQADPNSVENAFFFGNFYAIIGEKDSAITMWRKAGTINLEDKLGMVSAAKALYFQGDTTTAGQQFCEIIKKTKRKNPVVLHRIAETYATGPVKNLKVAEAYLRDAVRLDPKNLDAYVLLGDVLLAQSNANATAATEQYNNALAIDPNSARVIVRKAQIYQRVQNYKLANEEYKKAQAADPNYAPAYRENAELNILFDQYAAAIESWEKYLKLNDTDEARYRYASSLFGAKQYCNALSQIEQIEKHGFVNLYTKRMLYYSLYECNESADSLRYVQALNESENFLKIVPKEKIISSDYKYRGMIYDKLGQEDKTVEQYYLAAAIDTAKASEYLTDIAKLYAEKKNYPKLIEVYTKKMNQYPAKMQAIEYYDFGRAYYFGPKDYKMADSIFGRLVETSPTFPGGHFWQARARVQLDLTNKPKKYLAQPQYESFLAALTPEDIATGSYKSYIIEASKYLGDYYVNSPMKDKAKADAMWNKVLELDPNDAQAKAYFKK
ncbi:MAG: Tetratricopeptide 1 repeat-containing protein [Fluviicola sp.]|nr:Tetratricopeptide 1 repeat-containing protein [Fluviicola sp.]